MRIFEATSPETLKTAYIVNTNSVFTTVFAMVKPLLSRRTLTKIRVYGRDNKTLQKALLEEIPADQLPVRYGGTAKSSDVVS